MDWPGLEPKSPRWEAGDKVPEPWHGLDQNYFNCCFPKRARCPADLYFILIKVYKFKKWRVTTALYQKTHHVRLCQMCRFLKRWPFQSVAAGLGTRLRGQYLRRPVSWNIQEPRNMRYQCKLKRCMYLNGN
jgi:hypothetical protein